MSSNPVGVAIVTGGSSGIGLALTNHLIAKEWHVFILDVQPPALPLLPESSTFIKTDVADWDQLAAAFRAAHARFARLDFCALNAGIDDRDDIFNTISEEAEKPPRRPNMLTFEVNLFAPYYGLKLAAHYMSHNPKPTTQGGKIVITSSKAALLGESVIPQYAASKYGALGLARAVARSAEKVGIRVNCLCPGAVATGLAPPGLLDKLPEAVMTPMSTILRAFDELAAFDGLAAAAGGRAEWVRTGPFGVAIEADGRDCISRSVERDDSDGDGGDPEVALAWVRIYGERNKKFAEAGA